MIIEDNVSVVGTVASLGGSVELGEGSTVQGNIRTAGDVDLKGSSGVTGDMLIGGNLTPRMPAPPVTSR